MKLYPVKSNNLVTTSINTQFHVPKEYVDYTLGFTISMDLYYDPATWNASRYNSVCGRGNNTGFHSGMFVPGLISGNNFMGSWRNPGSYSTISSSGLTADWYRFSMVVTTTTAQIKLLNLRTNVELSGNVISVGTVTNGDNLSFTFLSYGIDGYTGAYGSIGINFSNITISRNGTCLLHVPLSSGAGTKVVDICNKTQYSLGFFTASSGWAKLSDYFHANFYYGHTLYTKSGSNNLHICNGSDGSEISITPPSGYTKVKNYGPSLTSFNQCESKFKLDNVVINQDLIVTGAGDEVLNGAYPLRGQYNGRNWYYDGKLSGVAQWTHAFNWNGSQWVWSVNPGTIMFYGVGDVQTPFECTSWIPASGSLPVGTISHGGERCVLSGTLTPTDYNGEYHEMGFWAGNKLYGKIGDEANKHIWKSGAPYDVYGWAIGQIDSQGYWYEYVYGNGNDDTPNPWDVTAFNKFDFVGSTGTGVVTLSESNTNELYLVDYDHILFTEGTGVAKEFDISTFDVTTGYNRGYQFINPNVEQTYFLMYASDMVLMNDVKVIKYIGLKDEIVYQDGEVVFDENDHTVLV